MSEEEDDVDVYKVYFKIIEEYWHVLELEDYETFDQFLEDLKEEWNKNKGEDAAFRKDDFGYFVDGKKLVPLLRIKDIGEMNKANGRIRKLTDVEILRMCVEENDAEIRKQLTSVLKSRFEDSDLVAVSEDGSFAMDVDKMIKGGIKVPSGKLKIKVKDRDDLVRDTIQDSLPEIKDTSPRKPWSVIGTVRVDDTKLTYTEAEFKRTITFGSQMARRLGGLTLTPLESIFKDSGNTMETLRDVLLGDRRESHNEDKGQPLFLHFIGHGSKKNGPVFKKQNGMYSIASVIKTSEENLGEKFLLCVVVNCCHSYELAKQIAEFVPYVVCWEGNSDGEVGDKVCWKFSNLFYEALFRQDERKGLDIGAAYRCTIEILEEHDLKNWKPRLLMHKNSSKIQVEGRSSNAVSIPTSPSRRMNARKAAAPMDLVKKDGGFVDGLREKDLSEVRRRLLSAEKEEEEEKSSKVDEEKHAIVGVYGINGMGGLGKSTLAQQIAQDSEILKTFKKGGVFWLTATKNTLNELNNLIHDLLRMHVPSVEKIETCSTIESAREMLKRVLTEEWKHSTPILIVVDDLWQASVYRDIVPDREWMPRGSSVLITYRDRRVAEDIVNESYVLFEGERSLSL